MKNGNHKRRKPHHSARPHTQTDSAEPLQNQVNDGGDPASQPWLRILSSDAELDPNEDRSEGLFAPANGRRQPSEPELHPSKGNLRRH